MNTEIRFATKADMPKVLELIQELAVFEKEPDAVEIDVDYLVDKGFGNQPEFTCFVAEVDTVICGIALVYKRFSTWKGITLHLEDLIVSYKNRGLGLGTKLLNRVVEYASELQVKRVTWEVLDWNQPAIDFYNKKGADIKADWRVVHLDESGIKNYLERI